MFAMFRIAAASVPLAAAHGGMTRPSSWHDPSSQYADLGVGAIYAGCTGGQAPGQLEHAQGCLAEWYTNYTFLPTFQPPTIPMGDPLITMAPGPDGSDWTASHPWRAPGKAPIHSPCGTDGGNPFGCPVGNPDAFPSCGQGGYGHGPDGRSLPGNQFPAQWTLGGEYEVGWAIMANHGGGYQYRLCKIPEEGRSALTEACFQQTPLPFVGDMQKVRFHENGTEVAFKALRTTKGTFPAGSEWTRNPIPGCYSYLKIPYYNGADGVCKGPQFEPPVPNLFGFSPTSSDAPGSGSYVNFPEHSIIDTIKVPEQLTPGLYAISFRYDCEMTSQVWNQCGDVLISNAVAV